MTEKELKKLSRVELLEMLIEQTERNEELEHKVAELEQQLYDKHINISEAGTLAEACLKVNKIFEAADSAASQYLENIRECEDRCKSMIADAESRCAEMESIAESRVAALKEEVDRLSNKWLKTDKESV